MHYFDIIMNNRKQHYNLVLIVATFLHFLVDLSCGFLVFQLCFNSGDPNYIAIILVAYNALAFGLQPIFGFLVDRFPKTIRYWKSFSLILLSLSLIVFIQQNDINLDSTIVFICLIIAGVSNAAFHVSFSKEIMADEKKYGLGIFVSSGALGIAIAYCLYGAFQILLFVIPFIVIPLGFVAVFMLPVYQEVKGASEVKFKNNLSWKPIAAALCSIIVAVFLRAMMGSYTNSNLSVILFSQQYIVVFSIAIGAFVGKFIGGFLIDWINEKIVLIVATIISISCLFFLNTHFVVAMIFSFSINMLMPLTLSMIKRVLPSLNATGFGLLAAVLFPGVFFAAYLKNLYYSSWILLAIVFINAVMLLLLLLFSKCFKKGTK